MDRLLMLSLYAKSRSARTARIEILGVLELQDLAVSRSARTARIEISPDGADHGPGDVAVRKDRED